MSFEDTGGTPVDSTSKAYTTRTIVKERIGITETTWDTMIDSLILVASRSIDNDTQRVFFTTEESRSFDGDGTDQLAVDDLLSVTSATLDDEDIVEDTDYRLLPYNTTPKYDLEGIDGAKFTKDSKNIVITGVWGFGLSVPEVIEQVTIERATRYWQQKGQEMMLSEEIGDYKYERFGVVAFSNLDGPFLKPYMRLEL